MDLHLTREIGAATENLPQPPPGTVVRTSEVNVIFTTPDATIGALRVAASIGRACNAPIRLLVQQSPILAEPNGESTVRNPVESAAFRARLTTEIDAHVVVLVCICRRAIDLARALLGRHSLVVIGGRRSWWPTRQERLRRVLEAEGHFVVFVNEADHAA